MAVYELFVDQFLPLYEGNTKASPMGAFATDTLVLTDYAKNFSSLHSVSDTLHLAQLATARKSIINVSVVDYLQIDQGGFRAAPAQTITQYLIIGGYARLVEFEQLAQSLILSQSAEFQVAKATFHTLELTQVVTYTIIRNLLVVQEIVIHSASTGIKMDENFYSAPLPTLNGPNKPEVP